MYLKPNTPILQYSNTPFPLPDSIQFVNDWVCNKIVCNKTVAIIPVYVGRIGKLYQGGKLCFSKCEPMC